MKYKRQSHKSLSNSQISRRHAIAKTKELLLQGPQNGKDCLVQPAPTIHPEHLIPELVETHDLKIVFIAPTNPQLTRMKQECRERDLSTRSIKSPYSKCPSYDGDHGDAVETKVKEAIREVPLGLLHKTQNLPCCPNCPFTNWDRPDFTEQVVLAHPKHAYIDGLLKDRVVFTCSLRGDAYITRIENPSQALNSYLEKNTSFTGYTDFIQNRSSTRSPSITDYANGSLDPSTPDEEFGYSINRDGHHLAPQIVFGLLHAEDLVNGWETSFHYHHDEYGNYRPTNRPPAGGCDPFKIGGIDPFRTRVVRQPGSTPDDDTIYILDVPDFTKAKSVVAFDIAPTPWMWRLYYGVNFDHQRVYSDDETVEFLLNVVCANFIQTATSRKPYDGRNVTPGRDASIAVWATAKFGKSPTVVSTKNALGRYRSNQPALLSADAKAGIQYRRGGSVITDDAPLLLLNGTPRPQDEDFQLWGALVGMSIPDSSNPLGSFGLIGDKIRHQFCESRVAKWATRFNKKNAVIILNTTAVPEWLRDSRLVTHASPTAILSDHASGQRSVARYLRKQAQSGNRVTRDDIRVGANVSGNTERKARKLFINQGWVEKHSTEGRQPNEYSWVA